MDEVRDRPSAVGVRPSAQLRVAGSWGGPSGPPIAPFGELRAPRAAPKDGQRRGAGLKPRATRSTRLRIATSNSASRLRGALGRAASVGAQASVAVLLLLLALALPARAQEVPELSQPVNDFANVIDPTSAAAMDRVIRSLQQTTGDAVVVATIETFAPFADIREYAVKLFENHGRGIGEKEKKNGLLVLVAVKDRKVWIEVGYGLEEFITDGYAGETVREFLAPAFRQGNYGAGLQAGVTRIIGRIAQARHVTLADVPTPQDAPRGRASRRFPGWIIIVIIIILVAVSNRGGPTSGYRRGWGGGGWSGWNSGIGSFGGGGGGGGGGFGGGFGGFGGGSSGGGGGGGSW
jgi:uncharacterized protein